MISDDTTIETATITFIIWIFLKLSIKQKYIKAPFHSIRKGALSTDFSFFYNLLAFFIIIWL